MDILPHENKIWIIISLILSCTSCNLFNEKLDPEEIREMRKDAMIMSQSILGDEAYWQIYHDMNDSIQSWIENKLDSYWSWDSIMKYSLDSVLCVNKKGDQIVATVFLPYWGGEATWDDIKEFYILKIKGKWYPVYATCASFKRANHQENPKIPISLEKMRLLGSNCFYWNYLTKKKKGKREINDLFFECISWKSVGVPFDSQEEWEEKWLEESREKWNHIKPE